MKSTLQGEIEANIDQLGIFQSFKIPELPRFETPKPQREIHVGETEHDDSTRCVADAAQSFH